MKAFNHFSVSRKPLKTPVRSFKEQEKGSSFLVCSLSKSEEIIELKRTADEAMIDPEAIVKKKMYSKQDSDLYKLLAQPNRDQVVTRPSNPSLIPDNNPFKIRKTDEINLEIAEYGVQELADSFVTKSKAVDVASCHQTLTNTRIKKSVLQSICPNLMPLESNRTVRRTE